MYIQSHEYKMRPIAMDTSVSSRPDSDSQISSNNDSNTMNTNANSNTKSSSDKSTIKSHNNHNQKIYHPIHHNKFIDTNKPYPKYQPCQAYQKELQIQLRKRRHSELNNIMSNNSSVSNNSSSSNIPQAAAITSLKIRNHLPHVPQNLKKRSNSASNQGQGNRNRNFRNSLQRNNSLTNLPSNDKYKHSNHSYSSSSRPNLPIPKNLKPKSNQNYLNNLYQNFNDESNNQCHFHSHKHNNISNLKQYGFRNSLPNLYNSFELEDVSRSLRMSRYRCK